MLLTIGVVRGTWKMKLKSKMIAGSVLLAVVPVIIAGTIISHISTDSGGEALRKQVTNQLIALRDTKKTQIESYFATIGSQLTNMANDPAVQEAFSEIAPAYSRLAEEYRSRVPELKRQLATYYSKQFNTEYSRLNAGTKADTKALLDKLDDKAVVLQHNYIVANKHPLGSKNLLQGTDDGSYYDDWHKHIHPFFNDFISRFGYYDLFLVHNDGTVLYTVFKELDFATNLRNGPYADSGLARAFKMSEKTAAGKYVIDDFAAYLPSYDGPASFAATPIFHDGVKVGVLILQMPIDAINAIMTNKRKWKEVGLGESGETYLVGPDMKARSISRFLAENKPGYITMLRSLGANKRLVKLIDVKGTNIGMQTINTEGVREAVAGKSGFRIFSNYRNVPVLSAYAPLAIDGVRWAILSEIDETEAFQGITSMSTSIRNWVIGIVLLLFIVAGTTGVALSLKISRPILNLSDTIDAIEKNADLTQRITVNSDDEIGMMAKSLNHLLETLDSNLRGVSAAATQMAAAAEELANITNETNHAIESQRQETDQVATAINQMSATVHEVARSAEHAAKAANDADDEAINGHHVVHRSITTIKQLAHDVEDTASLIARLEAEVDSIGSVANVISEIAEQTNLLALNAAIEAARAGEQGRGFAVVADEVRGLAGRTHSSTQEIAETIERLQRETKNTVAAMKQGQVRAGEGVTHGTSARNSLELITSAVNAIKEMNAQIASAAEQQHAVAEEINNNILRIREGAEHNADNASQTSRASEELAQLASSLQRMVAQFKL